jgi:hypothetical protein
MIELMMTLILLQDDAVVQKHVTYQLKKPADSKLSVESACYFHPLTTPSGAVVTDVAPGDHKHHRGIFLAWFDMKGKKDADFWGWGQYAPVKDRVIVNRGVKKGDATTVVENHWMAEGETLLKETLTFGHRLDGAASVLDLTYVLAADADVKIAKGAFSGFCLRMRKDGKATAESPEGEVKRPAPHHLKPESDWPAQPWYGYQITLPDGAQLGGAVLDHPKNPPALWHNSAPIRMINPCITAPADVVIKAGEPLTLRYRVVAWDGAIPREQLSSLSKSWDK